MGLGGRFHLPSIQTGTVNSFGTTGPMIGGTRSCRGRQTPHATASAEQRHHHATGIRRSRCRRTRREADDYDHGERLTDQIGRIRRNRFLRGQYSKFCRNPLAFARCKTPSSHWKTQPTLPTRGASKSCDTYSLRNAGLDACAWDPRIGWMTRSLFFAARTLSGRLLHIVEYRPLITVWQVAAPKPPSPPHPLEKLLSHTQT